MRWSLPPPVDSTRAAELAAEAGIAPWVAEVMLRRGMGAAADARKFLSPLLRTLGDPFLLPGMDAAVARIIAALRRKNASRSTATTMWTA